MNVSPLLRIARAVALLVPFLVIAAVLVFIEARLALSALLVGLVMGTTMLAAPGWVTPLYDYFARYLDRLTVALTRMTVTACYFLIVVPLGLFSASARRAFGSSRSGALASYWTKTTSQS